VGLWARLTDKLFGKLIEKGVGGWNIAQWQNRRKYYPDVSHKSLIEKYASWVYACAEKNAQNCAQVPLRLYAPTSARKTKALFSTRTIEQKHKDYLAKSPTAYRYLTKAYDVEEVTEHPFLDLMINVNDFDNQFDIIELMVLFQELCGNAYWYILKQRAMSVPIEIWPLYSQYMTIVTDKQRFIDHYVFAITPTEKHIVKTEDVVHFKYPNPQDQFYGMGPLQAAVMAADLSMNMNVYETSLLENDARPDMALIIPAESGVPPEEEQKRMRKEWYKMHRGVKRRGNMAILTGGAELKPVSLPPREMAFLEGRKATLNEIAAIFGVPMSKLTTENVNRANAEAGDYAYQKDTILPKLRKIEQKMNEKLLPMFDERLFVAFDNPVPEDKEYRLKEVKTHLQTGYSSPNEERQKDGLDEVDWGGEPLVPITLRPLSTETPASPQFVPPKSVKAPRKLPPINHPTNFVNQPFVEKLRGYYNRIAEEIFKGFDRDIAKSIKSPADDYISAWFDMQKWNEELWTTSEPFIQYTLLAGGDKALRQITTDRIFNPASPLVSRALTQHRYGMVQNTNSTVIKQLREKLAAGIDEGEGVYDLRKRVESVFEGLSAYGSERIARTETIWAWNEGAKQGYKQSGFVEKLQWLSSGDARSCDWCLDLDGTIIGIDDSFFGKGDSYELEDGRALDFNYEEIGHPPLHPQCRCTIVPVL
jgi:HK97 family phage portal protein